VVSGDNTGGATNAPCPLAMQRVAQPKRQVITVHPDGSITGLQRKRGDGFDLRQMGKVDIRRASHIVWCAETQKWFIELLEGPYAGLMVTHQIYSRALSGDGYTLKPRIENVGKWDELLFDDYDDAVRTEIAVLDGMRLRGWL
jgi:hypothetical protein